MASGGTCSGGVAVGECASAGSNRWVRCKAGGGRTDGRSYSYPTFETDAGCAPSIALGDIRVQLAMETLASSQQNNLVACENVAVTGYRCSDLASYGQCMSGPGGDTYTCGCDANGRYRYPTFSKITSQGQCGRLPTLVQAAVTQAQERQQSCGSGCVSGNVIYGVDSCLPLARGEENSSVCTCDETTSWQPRFVTREGDACPAAGQGIGSVYSASSGYYCADDGNVYKDSQAPTLVQPCRSIGLICGERSGGTIQCLGASTVDQLTQAGLGGLASEYECVGTSQFRRSGQSEGLSRIETGGAPTTSCPLGTACVTQGDVVSCQPTQAAQQQYLVSLQQASQCSGGGTHGTSRTVSGAVQICRCRISNSVVVPNSCQWEASRPLCSGHFEGENWVDGSFCKTCVVAGGTGQIVSEPLFTGSRDERSVASGCAQFYTSSQTAIGEIAWRPIAQISTAGTTPGRPYCDGSACKVVTMEPGGSLSSTQTVTATGYLSAYAANCPSDCAVYGQDTGIQRTGATLSRCSEDGSSVLFFQPNPRGPAPTTPTREEYCASGLCSNGACVAGVQVFDATTGNVRMCAQGETCRVVDPVTGMTLTQQIVARTENGQTAYETQTQWAPGQAGALQAQAYRALYEQNAPQYLARFYSPTYVQAYEQYRDEHPGATIDDFQQVQAEALSRIQPTLDNLGILTQDYLERIGSGEYIPTDIEATLDEQQQNLGVRILLGLNNFTSGATRRGNELLLQSSSQIREEGLTVANTYNYVRGALIQGAAPAAITAAIAGFPALAIISAPVTIVSAVTVGGTAIGVAGTTYSLQQTAEMCAPGRIATSQCAFAAGNSAFAAFSTGVGVVGGTMQLAAQANLARSGVSLAQHADDALGLMTRATVANMSGQSARVASLNRTVAAAGTFLFGGQAVNSCLLGVELPDGTRRPDPLNCAMNSAMALTSAFRFVTASVGIGNTTTTAQRAVETADFGVNSVQAIVACASGGLQRDFVGCSQSLAGAALSGGGAYTVAQDLSTGVVRNLDETPTARYEAARQTLFDLYTDSADGGSRVLWDDVTPQQLQQVETLLREAILVRAQEQAAIDIAMRRVGGDPLAWTISQGRLNDAQGAYTTALEAYRAIEEQPVGVRLASPEFASYQQTIDNLTRTRAAVGAEEAVLTSPRSTIQRITDRLGGIVGAEPEILVSYRNAQDEFGIIARNSDPQSPEYQQSLAQLLAAREGLVDYGYTTSQREITQELTPRQEELRRQTQDLQRMEQELLILTNAENAQRVVDRVASAVDAAVARGATAEEYTQLVQTEARMRDLARLADLYQTGDAQAMSTVIELETQMRSVAQGREVLGQEVAALAAARDQAGTLGGRLRELFGGNVSVDTILNRVTSAPETGEVVVSERQTTPEEAQSVPLRDRLAAFVFGTQESPTLLGRLRGTRAQQQESATPQTHLIQDTDTFTRQSQERPDFVTSAVDEGFRVYQQEFNEQTQHTPGQLFEGRDSYAFGTSSLLSLQTDTIIGTMLETRSTLRVLDVGTGNGQFLEHAASLFPDRVVVSGLSANDYRSEAIRSTGLEYTIGNAERIASLYPQESFDLIVSAVTATHFVDPLGTIEQMYSLLARDGMLVVDYFEAPGLEGRLSDVISYLRDQGYTVYASYENDLQYRGPETQFDTFIIRKTLPELRFPVTYQTDAQREYGFRYLLSDAVAHSSSREIEILDSVLPGENTAFSDYLGERSRGMVSDDEGTLRPLLNEYSRYLLEQNSQDRAYLQREFGLTAEDSQNRAFLNDALTQAGGQRLQPLEQARSALVGLADRIGNPRDWPGAIQDAVTTESLQDNWNRFVNLSLPALIYGRGDVGYQAPQPWFIDVLSADPNFVSYTPFYRQGISARDLVTVDATRFPQQDREAVETTQNIFRDFLMAPELIDAYESHTQQRRPWLQQTRSALEQSRGADAANEFFTWYSSNKLSQGELGKVIMAVQTLAFFSSDYFPAEFTAEVDAFHGTYFQVERTDEATGESFTRYDDLPLEGKLEIVEHMNDVAQRALQYLSQYGQ